MSPFTPSGTQARWRVLYRLLQPLAVGDLLDYETMADALGLDSVKDRTTIQLAMRRAARELEQIEKRAVDAVKNEGYRVVEPEEHADLAKRHQTKSNRSLQRGQSKVVNVDLSGMEPETRKAIELMAQAFAAQLDFNRRMDVRQQHLEKAMESVTEQQERTDEQLADLQERLRRLEHKTSGESNSPE